jgi:hypothetical protein
LPMVYLRWFARQIANAGLFFNIMGINLNRKFVIATMCIGNVIMMTPSLWMPFRRYGPDYTAYINQAGQFVAGQTNYVKISSV